MSDQEHTTAVIVAVPAADDPVHDVVADDAHITLYFLGEAAELPGEGVEEIQAALTQLAEALFPFPAKVSGTALLGDDQANVLLVESAPLAKIHELIGTVPPVSTALEATADDQFPTWIPHLTLAYPDDDGMGSPVTNPPVGKFTVGGLELWLAGEKFAYPFQKTAPQLAFTVEEEEPTVASSPITAAVGEFDPSLHPRGADGRFIEKFGIIKYLLPKGTWAYGKVEGISKDETNTVHVTVTPSTLTGIKLSGEPKDLLPKQIYRAPKAKAHLTTKDSGAQKIGGQGGSNPGGLYSIPSAAPVDLSSNNPQVKTEKYYVKTPKSKSHGANEALANHLYEEAGVPVPEVDLHADGQIYSKIVNGQPDMASQLHNPAWADQVRRNFAVDAWLGNRDVFGMTYDNILTDEAGTAWRIDNGGALLYRAMGEKKTDFGGKVTELDSFRTGKKAKIFGSGMTKIQELDGAQRVLAILPQRIDEMVAEAGLPKSLADTLKARRAYIADYYGLDLPEASKPAGAQDGTSAPLVDAADLAKHQGKSRDWFKAPLHQAALLLSTGDTVEVSSTTGTGATDQLKYGVDVFGKPLSGLGAQAQVLGWQQTYGADAQVMFKKAKASVYDRPDHGSKLMGADLADQNWQRGDKLASGSGITWTVKGANPTNGAVLLESNDGSTLLLDTHGKDGAGVWEVQRWDPPAAESPVDEIKLVTPTMKAEPFQSPDTPEIVLPSQQDSQAAVDTPAPNTEYPFPPVTINPPKEKTGQAAEAEAAIKADLDQPLPTGNGAPEPKKTAAKSGEKKMLIGDGTEAAPGAELVSKKDGKTYTFVKPKGQYAVVTDPNGDDPEKQLLKLASTMTQPGQLPVGELEVPKTATGEVPALGMMAVSKDGHAGEITLISPDGKFVFITDANGTRKRKSTGTVSITGGTPAVADAPKKTPGPIKDYGNAPSGAWTGPQKVTAHLLDPATAQDKGEPHLSLSSEDMVHVGYADGTSGLEPYSGQPLSSLATNAQGMVTVHGFIEGYLGPIDSKQFAQGMTNNSAEEFGSQLVFSAVWNGTIFQTNGMTGPNGGLILFDATDPNDYAMELPPEGGQMIQLVEKHSGVLPSWDTIISPQADDGAWSTTPTVLYGEEAKTLADWKGEIYEGVSISLDGKNWLRVENVYNDGGVLVSDSNGATTEIWSSSSATFVIEAPELKDGDAAPGGFTAPEAAVDTPAGSSLFNAKAVSKPVTELNPGDVIDTAEGLEIVSTSDGKGQFTTIQGAEPVTLPSSWTVGVMGNAFDAPVDMNVHQAIPLLQPGNTIDAAEGVQLTVLSFPSMQDDGSFHFAAMTNGNPNDLELVSSSNFGENVTAPVFLGAWASHSDMGVDTKQVNALFDAAAHLHNPKPTDHHAEMTNAGISFGTAGYPIFNKDGAYYRQGPTGLEFWNDIPGEWETHQTATSTAGMDKVWDGKPFEGSLNVPAGTDLTLFGPETAAYKPQPGEAVAITTMSSGTAALAVSPSGSFADGQQVHTIMVDKGTGQVKLSSNSYDAKELHANGETLTVIHDPFAETEQTPQLTHHEGEMPQVLADAFQKKDGYEAKPGATYFVVVDKNTGFPGIYEKNDKGQFAAIQSDGKLATHVWSMQEVVDSFDPSAWDTFTWTAPGAQKKPVQNLPSGYAPFTPGEGQSVLKVTTSAGKQTVLVQQHPGAGWYVMDADGSINESSDAVKSDYVVQKYLSGSGNAKAGTKYELLHPVSPGADPVGAPGDLPTFNGYQVKPGEKIVKVGGPYDTDPWFYLQTEPGSGWYKIQNDNDGEPGYTDPWNGTGNNSYSDADIQGWLTNDPQNHQLAWDGTAAPSVDTTTDGGTQSFDGYTPKPGEKVVGETNDYWVQSEPGGEWSWIIKNGTNAGQLQTTGKVSDTSMQAYIANGTSPVVFGGDDAAATVFKAPGAAEGYTPKPGEQVWKDNDGDHWVNVAQDKWSVVKDNGELSTSQISQHIMENYGGGIVWPVDTPVAPGDQGIVAKGYQTKKTDNVIQLSYSESDPGMTLIWDADQGYWLPIFDGGTIGSPTDDGYTQDTIDWALSSQNSTTVHVLQGLPKGIPASAEPKPLLDGDGQYAGVAEDTPLSFGSQNFGGYTLDGKQSAALLEVGTVPKGASIYAIQNGTGNDGSLWIRYSDGTWKRVDPGTGISDSGFDSDAKWEKWVAEYAHTVHKMQFGAPTTAPVVKKPYNGPAISGWADAGIPDPTTFNAISDASEAKGAKKGSWVYMASPTSDIGMFMQLGKDWDGSTEFYPQKVHTVSGNKVGPVPAINYSEDEIANAGNGGMSAWNFVPTNQFYISGDPAPAAPGGIKDLYEKLTTPQTPAAAPAAPTPKPSYPGALAPSQEDINAWGGSLTKDGHIPSAGMFVSGKGPMSGKIISVSKDKTKAVVLTSEGKKTTRLIEALKTDKSANYSAYAAPATAKDIPQGMPLAVDTAAEALDKTAKDGKFRAILNGHPGVSGGQMVVTKTTAPSGKIFNRVHLTLTPAQREQLVAMLSGTGEKGDWVTSSKMSDMVAIGDELPMRKSSTDNPDGTPRWKVDSSIKPPTHSVVKVEDDPSGSGIKIVTMKDKNTGELITSRFHPGKSLTTYNWDPNKPKAMTAGAFNLSEAAKGMGWIKTSDGGISAIKGGADNGQLYHEPGQAVTKGAFQDAGHSWDTLRNVSDDGVVIELVAPKGPNSNSTTGATVISVPQGVDEKALGAALAKLGVDYRPMTQDDAKVAVRGTLRTLLNLDTSDVDTAKGWSDEKLFAQAGQSMGITDLGWHDVLIGVDDTTGKTSFFWSDRARNAIAAKTSYNLVYRSATTGDANAIVSTVKYGSANSVLKRTTGMIDTPTGKGTGASWSSDQANHAGHGSYSSAASKTKLPTSNSSASYKSTGMMVYSRPEAVLGRIADFRLAQSDAFGMGQGSGSDHLKAATTMSSVKDFFIGGGLPTEAVGYIAVQSASARTQAIAKLKADGFAMINGRPIEEIVILMTDADKLKPSDLPPVTLPANARPILDLPTSYDTPAAAPAGEAA